MMWRIFNFGCSIPFKWCETPLGLACWMFWFECITLNILYSAFCYWSLRGPVTIHHCCIYIYKKKHQFTSQQIRILHKTNKKTHFLVNCWPSGKYVNLLYMYSILGNTSRWHGSPNHHWLWKLHTGLQATWILCLSTLPPDSGTLISKLNAKFTLQRGLWTTEQQSSSFSPQPR